MSSIARHYPPSSTERDAPHLSLQTSSSCYWLSLDSQIPSQTDWVAPPLNLYSLTPSSLSLAQPCWPASNQHSLTSEVPSGSHDCHMTHVQVARIALWCSWQLYLASLLYWDMQVKGETPVKLVQSQALLHRNCTIPNSAHHAVEVSARPPVGACLPLPLLPSQQFLNGATLI